MRAESQCPLLPPCTYICQVGVTNANPHPEAGPHASLDRPYRHALTRIPATLQGTVGGRKQSLLARGSEVTRALASHAGDLSEP